MKSTTTDGFEQKNKCHSPTRNQPLTLPSQRGHQLEKGGKMGGISWRRGGRWGQGLCFCRRGRAGGGQSSCWRELFGPGRSPLAPAGVGGWRLRVGGEGEGGRGR